MERRRGEKPERRDGGVERREKGEKERGLGKDESGNMYDVAKGEGLGRERGRVRWGGRTWVRGIWRGGENNRTTVGA